jgi:thiamine kinase-like enzyme
VTSSELSGVAVSITFDDSVRAEQQPVIRRVFAQLQLAAASTRWRVARLEMGANNENFIVTDADDQRYVLRIARPTAERFGIDRVRNVEAHRAAAQVGVAPDILAAKLPEGHYLSRFVHGPLLNNERMHEPGVVTAVGRALRRLHSAPAIDGSFSVFDDTRRYLAIAAEEQLALPDGMDAYMLKVDQIERAFRAFNAADCVCHNDLVPQNILVGGDGIKLIDFEFAGMGNPYFDLGNFAADAELTASERSALVEAYFGAFDRHEAARVQLMVFMSGIRDALWSIVAEPVLGDLEWDYQAWSEENLRRARSAATNDVYYQLLALARRSSAATEKGVPDG